MLIVERFINELMSSNCYIIYGDSDHCLIVDPGSEKCANEIEFIKEHKLNVDYIILTHEHTDHTWGCNTIIDKYNAKVICSQACKNALPDESSAYFQFYYDDLNYKYTVKRVDYTIEEIRGKLLWSNHDLKFISTPGHSDGSICFSIDEVMLFTGDTIMQYKSYIHKKRGDKLKYKDSVNKIINYYFNNNIKVYPGHGNSFLLNDYILEND